MIETWDRLAAGAPSLLQTLIGHELQVIVVLLIVLSVDRLSRNAPSAFRYMLWLIGLARALWPPMLDIPRLSVVPGDFMTIPQLLNLFSTAPSFQQDQSFGTLSKVLLLGWALTSVALAILFISRFLAFRLRLHFSRPLEWEVSQDISRTQRRWPPVFITDRLRSPATIGLLRPRIYLTPVSVKSNRRTLRAILHHELAHVMRKDGWVSLLQGVALVLHPLNPVVWLMNRRLSDYREQSCDDFALRKTGIDSEEYGHMLLGHLRQSMFPVLAIQTRSCFLQTKKSLIQRFLYLRKWKEGNMKIPAPRKQVILVAGLMTAVVFMALQCQEEASPLAQEKPPPTIAQEEGVKFVPYDTPPSPVGGFAAIQQQLHYPEESLKDGSQGTVILQLRVLADGTTGQVVVLKNETGDPRLAQAAVEALRHVAWNPAKAKDENVSVWIAVPINFKLP